MIIPNSVLAATWIPFSVVFVVEFLACVVFVQYFASRKRRECGSFIVCVLGLLVALLSSSLLPVDIFLVSYAKEDGQFKDWAATNESRNEMTELMQDAYYGLYALDMLFVFCVLPFVFFYNQSRDEEDQDSQMSSRCVSALKWTVGFLLIAGLLLALGALIPLREAPNSNSSITDLEWIIPQLGNEKGENSLALVVNVFTTLGIFFLCFYGAYGMAAMPVSWMFGRLSLSSTRDDLVTSEQALKVRIESAKKRNAKVREVSRMEGELEDVKRQLQILEQLEAKCCANCGLLWRPFQLLFGVLFFLLSLFIVGVIITTNLDRILNGEGYKYGYVLNGTAWGNPIDWVLTELHIAFPMDYITIVCLLFYIVICVVAGIVKVGIRICCVSLYKIRARKTKPEALLFLVYILIFAIMAVNVLFFSIAPGYYSYGTQTWNNNTGNGTTESVRCADFPKPGECLKTANADFLLGYFYKMWVFGAIYYWANWLFVSIFFAGLIFRCAKGRPKATDAHFQRGYDSEDEDNESETDNDPLLPAYRP
ncbi:putative lysosomal cobalamin transporter [Convolutriloba macropyga]|uniref:putative lysosomal cobalamin transporter n=1 Tax=Convolutriloba macropyga TaxID=536237 RepID=UPI003F527213